MSSLLALGGCGAHVDGAAASADGMSQSHAGLRAYIDPATGELGAPPADSLPTATGKGERLRAAATNGAARTGIETPVVGGGYAMRPAQPISSEIIACILADGHLKLDCTAAEVAAARRAENAAQGSKVGGAKQ